MGLERAVRYAATGYLSDLFAPNVTRGPGTGLGFLTGLFEPDAFEMARAYRSESARDRGALRSFGGFRISDHLFGTEAPASRSTAGVGALATALISAAILAPLFSAPLYGFNIYSTPLSPAGLIPLAWSAGLIRNWGWLAGFVI